jgi:myosin heavy subunit
LAVEQENRSLRDTNFELQSKTRAAETLAKRIQIEVTDKEKQLRIMTDQNSELLRLLEGEEAMSAKLQGEVGELRAELDELRQKYNALLTTAKTHEELATKAAKEGQLRAEEIRLLRIEVEQLKQQNIELKMKTQIEVEALQEQLRVRKEKQYQILEKMQAQEEAKRQAEDQVAGMEEQLRGLHARNIDLETQSKVESRSKNNIEEANKELQLDNFNLSNQNKELQNKIEKSEKERLRMESEARVSGEKLREMAEKVFQLLERLKLAELGKSKAMEALKKKELDMISLQKKNARLIKESTEESKAKVKVEMDNKVLLEQIRALKKNNTALAQKSKEEGMLRMKVSEERDQLDEKLKTMESRISFLLNKVQADEEARILQAEDRKKLESQVLTYNERNEELQRKVTELAESNRLVTHSLRVKQEELSEMKSKYDFVMKELESKDNELSIHRNDKPEVPLLDENSPDDIENVRLNEGRGRFYVEARSVGGGSLLLLKGRKPIYKDWLEKHGINEFLKKIQKTTRFRDLVVEKLCSVFGLLMVEEEEKTKLVEDISLLHQQLEVQIKKLSLVQDSLAVEEEAKQKVLMRYIHVVKERSASFPEGTGGSLTLDNANIGDEEVHAMAAMMRDNTSIQEVNLRGNSISDDGARALAAVLSRKSGLKLLDLRGNKISKAGIKTLAEALERSDRIKHVYVHAGGKIEALGANHLDGGKTGSVETVCIVDVTENKPEDSSFPYRLEDMTSVPVDSKFKLSDVLTKSRVPPPVKVPVSPKPFTKKVTHKQTRLKLASLENTSSALAVSKVLFYRDNCLILTHVSLVAQ